MLNCQKRDARRADLVQRSAIPLGPRTTVCESHHEFPPKCGVSGTSLIDTERRYATDGQGFRAPSSLCF
jgi:hypothetical protein